MVKKFAIGLSEEELKKRTSKDYLATKKMLDVDAPEYEKLKAGDKEALKHLVKAAYILEEVFLKKEIKAGNKNAKLAMKLFEAQKGINAVDSESNKFSLMKGEHEYSGKGLYPEDLSVKEFHEILLKMLKDGKDEEVKAILNQRSIIVRAGKELKAIDYTEYFKEEFTKASKELELASKASTNKDFSEYLSLQIKALTENNPMADANADKKWASLQDTPLEFTITRENYADEMTGTVVENEELKNLLEKKKITPVGKDMLGFRVGIINKSGTKKLLEIKKYLPKLAKEMPFADQYEQLGQSGNDGKEVE